MLLEEDEQWFAWFVVFSFGAVGWAII